MTHFKPYNDFLPVNFFLDQHRGWLVKVLNVKGEIEELTVDPEQYSALLKDPNIESVQILKYGTFIEGDS
jgi:hypothetical protein